MKIVSMQNNREHGLLITALIGKEEFKQLHGHLCKLLVFPTLLIEEPATFIKTGAKHNCAKYVLVPVRLRRQLALDDYDFSSLRCAAMEGEETVFLIYSIPKKAVRAKKKRSNGNTNSQENPWT